MLKKIGYFIFILIVMTLVVNIILGIISILFPIEFVIPESLIEAPRAFEFAVGNMKLSLNQTVLNTWAIMTIIIIIIIAGTRNLSVDNPSKLQIILEEYYHFIENTFLVKFGKLRKKFIPFFSALFAFIVFSNLSLFLFPFMVAITKGRNGVYEVHHFFRTPTADLNTTVGLALVVLVVSTITAIKQEGLKKYLKSYIEPMWFMLPMNVVEKISSVLNISMRLFGNMLSGLVIAGLLYSLSGYRLMQVLTKNALRGPFSFSVGWPMILQLYLDLFVGVIQAFVFTILSAVYVSESISEESEAVEE